MEPVKFGVVGVGGMGGSHARSFAGMEEAELVAVADVNAEMARKVGEETGAQAFATAEEMIARGGIEAVIIATPHFFHPPVAEYAAERGVHVLTEKPIAVTVSAADRMIEACEKGGVLLGVGFQQRTEPKRRKMKELVQSGALGNIHRVSMIAPWYRPQFYYNSGAWRGTWKGEGGGILMNQAPHSLDQFLWIGGQPQKVQAIAATRLHQIEVENTGLAIFDYGDGKVGWLYASTAEVPGGERFEIAGDNGLLVLEEELRFFELDESIPHHLQNAGGMFEAPKGAWRTVEVEEAPSGSPEIVRNFARAVRANDASLLIADGEAGLRSLELANSILLAGYTRRQTDLPVDRAAIDEMLRRLQEGAAPQDLRA